MFFYLYAYEPTAAGKGWKNAIVTWYQKFKESMFFRKLFFLAFVISMILFRTLLNRKMWMTLSEFAAQMLMKGRVNTSYVFYVHPDEIEAITREFAAIGNNLNQIAAFFNSGGLPSHVMCENINHAISCIFEMRKQVAEMAGKNYGNLKAYRK